MVYALEMEIEGANYQGKGVCKSEALPLVHI